LAVEAHQDCLYTLAVSDNSNQVLQLERGKFGFLNLARGEVKYFFVREVQAQAYLKFLSLHVYGRVEFYLNHTSSSALQTFRSENADPSTFQFKGQYINRLVLEQDNVLFCEGCSYLLAVVAQKVTRSTLFFGDGRTPLPIRDKVINDIILTGGQVVKGEYYGQLRLELQVKVHSGRLRLSLRKGDQAFEQDYGPS
jgi:hypothetical protein